MYEYLNIWLTAKYVSEPSVDIVREFWCECEWNVYGTVTTTDDCRNCVYTDLRNQDILRW